MRCPALVGAALLTVAGCGLGAGIYRAGAPPKERFQREACSDRRNADGSVTRTCHRLDRPIRHTSGESGQGLAGGVDVGPWWGAAGRAGRQPGVGIDAYLQYSRSAGGSPLGWAVRSGLGARSIGDHPAGWWIPLVPSLLVGKRWIHAHVGAGPIFGKIRVGDGSTSLLAGGTVRAGLDFALPFKAMEILVGAALHYVGSTSADLAGDTHRFNDAGVLFRVMLGL